ncbi:MAG TPA: malto-oligosyltrehalose synthase, partial [Polyangia bacterium]|nr:malto-oligosyltrehalose synthase [Polyangia bacterium]
MSSNAEHQPAVAGGAPAGPARGAVAEAPSATYRLQLTKDLTLAQAEALVPYLAALGVSHLYTSPLLAARLGSQHGYDVIDHARLNPELGTEAEFRSLATALRARGMGMIVDVVPNHMCISDPSNQRWQDVLENGPGAASTEFFDIDWGPPKPELAGKVLLPILGEQFGRELERGALEVRYTGGAFSLCYGDHCLPLDPRSWRLLLEPLWRLVVQRVGGEAPASVELESILRALGHWPTARAEHRARRHEREALVRRIAQQAGDAPTRRDLDEVLAVMNGTKGEPHSFDPLERLVQSQSYRLAHWRVAAHEINYRRFFDINDLAAIRVERQEVFDVVHQLPRRWLAEGLVSGFRVDHVDGLREPARYLERLSRLGDGAGTGAPFIAVEKILAAGERLPDEWAADGTTGYEHAATVAGVLVDTDNAALLRDAWRKTTGETQTFADVAYNGKRLILATAVAAELTVLARRLDAISEQHRYTRDFTFASLAGGLREVLACFPVYRTYVTPDTREVTARDQQVIARAVREAAWRNPVINRSLFRFIEDVLLLRDPEGLTAAEREQRRDFVLRVQQLTGPVMAKGVEDTAFYRYFPLLSLAEVGGDPDRLGITVAEFHQQNRRRAESQPRGLSASATHDTKRGEDLRARLHVLSEVPKDWTQAVARWRELNQGLRADATGVEQVDTAIELFIYQSLVASWPPGGGGVAPDYRERFQAYLRKAIAEAKLRTSWINPDGEYEQAVAAFVDGLLDSARSGPFLESLQAFVDRIAGPGIWNSLAQVLLKVAGPGIPDVYNGCELWDFSFTDPDNRRPVDFHSRQVLLAQLTERAAADAAGTARALLATPNYGAIKMFVLQRALRARQANADAFAGSSYEPCAASGRREQLVLAFARGERGRRVLAVTGRLFTRLCTGGERPVGNVWYDTRVALPDMPPGARYREALTDRWLAPERRDDAASFALADVCA